MENTQTEMAMTDQSSHSPCPSSIANHSLQIDESLLFRDQSSSSLKDLTDSKAELLARVQSLRNDLREWRGRLDSQVQTYRQELGELRNSLNVEVEELKTGFHDLRVSLRKQLDITTKLSESVSYAENIQNPCKISSPVKPCSPLEKDEAKKQRVVIKKNEENGMEESYSDSESFHPRSP